MVKLFKNALGRVLEQTCRKPTVIELQTFFSDAVRIVNDRPLTTPSDQPNDLSPITPSCFLGQHLSPNTPLCAFHEKGDLLSPNTPLCAFHEKGDLRRDFIYNSTLADKFWLLWMKSYLHSLSSGPK